MIDKQPYLKKLKEFHLAKYGEALSDEEAVQQFEHLIILVEAVYGPSRVKSFKAGGCPGCEEPVNHDALKEDIEQREYMISGLCKDCQDKHFSGHGN